MKTGLHTRLTGTVGDLYLTLAEEVVGAPIGGFPTGDEEAVRDRLINCRRAALARGSGSAASSTN